MAYAVKYQHERYGTTLKPGDVLVSNHPIAGGTHLPDITVITPVFDPSGKEIIFYTASRGHHRDIGGFEGISGNANATDLYQEGARIVSFKLVSNGRFDEEGITKILVEEPGQFPDCVGTSSLYDNLSDLRAQVAANAKGSKLIEKLFEEYGREVVQVSNLSIPIYLTNSSPNHRASSIWIAFRRMPKSPYGDSYRRLQRSLTEEDYKL